MILLKIRVARLLLERRRFWRAPVSTLISGMSIEGHERLSTGEISRNIDLLPACKQECVALLIRSAEFRALPKLEDQIEFFKGRTKLPLDLISLLLGRSKATLSRYLAARALSAAGSPKEADTKKRHGPNSSLTISQEEQLIAWISQRQKEQNCPTPHEVREYGAQLKREAEGGAAVDGEHLSRDWWHNFKRRHEDVIGVKLATSREQARTRCTEAEVRQYFATMESILSRVKSLSQIINMDETGFHSRIDRDRKRKCVYNKQCDTHVTFCEETASTTLSMMIAIAADTRVLRPMFVCKENVMYTSDELKSIKDFVSISRSAKGYATEANMLQWIDEILVPYVEGVTSRLPDHEDKVYLIMDNCGIHNSTNVRKRWQEIERLEIVWIPPHSSHFLQMLDGAMFGALKSVFRNLRTPKTRPKIEGKIFRAYKAFWAAAFPATVMGSYQITGFRYLYVNGAPRALVVDTNFVNELVASSCLASTPPLQEEAGNTNLE